MIIYYLLSVFILAVATRNDRSRSESSPCPRLCSCSVNTIECLNVHLRGNVFRQIQHDQYSALDTLVLSGNKFEDLYRSLFEEDNIHSSLSLINLTSNGIRRISRNTFSNLPSLEYLYLNDNSIQSAGKGTFNEMDRLKEIDLSNALGKQINGEKTKLLLEMFSSNSKDVLPELTTLKLAKNGITNLDPNTFCKISGLIHLDLSENKLSSFEVAPTCMKSLKALILRGNQFTTLPSSLWESFPILTSFDISANPLDCNCELEPFHAIAGSENVDFVNQGLTYCSAPANLKGKNFFELSQNLCTTSSWGFGTFVFLSIMAAAALFIYRHYRKRVPTEVPFQFGYSGLDMEEDVQPEFV